MISRYPLRTRLRCAAFLLVLGAVAPGEAYAFKDFNGDGYEDLVVGAPDEDIGDVNSTGMVSVYYGSPQGLARGSPAQQHWQQNTPGIIGNAEAFDDFGQAVAVGDFDDDGYDDLAVGVPHEDITSAAGELRNVGGVHIIYGSHSGLAANGDQLIDLRILGSLYLQRSGRLGAALTVGLQR